MNQQLISQIKTRANVTDETAEEAAEAVMAFLTEKLPDSVAPHVLGVMRGESAGDQMKEAVAGKLGGLGGMFGKK